MLAVIGTAGEPSIGDLKGRNLRVSPVKHDRESEVSLAKEEGISLQVLASRAFAVSSLNSAASDLNSGGLSAPWKTITQLNAYALSPGFQPGDTIYLEGEG